MYGTYIKKYSNNKHDKYGFVNEHEIRISTGITLVLGLLSLFLVLFKANYDIPLFIVGTICLDFILKVFISPNFSIYGNITKLFIKKREPIWVGAVQKRFAWSIGVFISVFVLFCLLTLGGYTGIINPSVEWIWKTTTLNIKNGELILVPLNPAIIACVICIIFMWFESVAGYCIGCSIYAWLVKKGRVKKYIGQNCIDGKCEI